MKLKIAIIGPKVHDVGYRPWLTELAMNTALRGFEVYNDDENGQQAVIALAEADEQRIKRFLNTVKTMQPQLAEVSEVTSGEYTGAIMPVWQAATMGSFTQLNKAVPILLEMQNDLKDMKVDIKEMKGDLEAVKQNTSATLEEVKGLREEIQPRLGEQLRQMQADIRALKDRVGMH
ncbi:MAG: acylphosphatase [Methanotrichaceae archaeon]